jgi:hypothetical protein
LSLPTTVQLWAVIGIEDYGLKESIHDKDKDLFLTGRKIAVYTLK